MTHALVRTADNAVLRYPDFDGDVPVLADAKGLRWLPVVETDPPHDPETEVRTGPVVTVGEAEVTRVWTVTAKSAETLAAELAALKADLVRRNNDACGAERRKQITDIAGQENTYREKQLEAERWIAAGSPESVDPEDYPWAVDRAAVKGWPSPVYALTEWAEIRAGWLDLGRRIEKERERVNEAIMDAATAAEAQAAFDGADYPQS